MKKLLMGLLILGTGFSLQGCDDTTAAAGAGFVGGVLIGSRLNDRGPVYRRCSVYTDYYGRSYRDCRRGYGGRNYRGDRWYNNNVVDIAANTAIVPAHTANFAEKYKLSYPAAQKVVNAFDQGAQGDFAGFNSLGWQRSDFQAVADGKMPSDMTINQVSKELKADVNSVRRIMKDAVREVQKKKVEMERNGQAS